MAVSGISGSNASGLDASRQTIAQNFDTFLSLLTTQLQNQNPLDPLDTNQFTQQLVQFTSVEQQLKTNDFLQAMLTQTQNTSATQATGYIGKEVTASGTKAELKNGKAEWQFYLENDASKVTVAVKDKDGKVVHTYTGALEQGAGKFSWDGIGDDGKKYPEGSYTVAINARDADNHAIEVRTTIGGVVQGVDLTGSEPVLLVGDVRINLSMVTNVRQATPATDPTPDTPSPEGPEPDLPDEK